MGLWLVDELHHRARERAGRRARTVYDRVPEAARRPLVATVGGALVAAGLALLVLPGPGLLLLAAGLAILALEFRWARRLLAALRHGAGRARDGGRRPDGPGG